MQSAPETKQTSKDENLKARQAIASSKYKQQKLRVCQPRLLARTIFPIFIGVGLLFIPLGIALFMISESVEELSVDYTKCQNSQKKPCFGSDLDCTCVEPLVLANNHFENKPVYVYYALTNFYQNHRKYVKSRDDNQLVGKISDKIDSNCEPFHKSNSSGKMQPIYPCGAVADSMFTDKIEIMKGKDCTTDGASCTDVTMKRDGIAWKRLKNSKYKMAKVAASYEKPTRWASSVEVQLGKEGVGSEDFIVWMTIAPLPEFRKLYGIVEKGLSKGDYTLKIQYDYLRLEDDDSDQGQAEPWHNHKKLIVLSTTCALGGKNPFLSYCFVLVGFFSLILGLVLIVLFLKVRKRRSRVSALPLPQPPPEPPEEQAGNKPRASTSSLGTAAPRPTLPPPPGAKPSVAPPVKA